MNGKRYLDCIKELIFSNLNKNCCDSEHSSEVSNYKQLKAKLKTTNDAYLKLKENQA